MIICSYSLFGDYVSVVKVLVISVDSLFNYPKFPPYSFVNLTLLKDNPDYRKDSYECQINGYSTSWLSGDFLKKTKNN
jgi:hypothetical protein